MNLEQVSYLILLIKESRSREQDRHPPSVWQQRDKPENHELNA